jgi:hypothetical protein
MQGGACHPDAHNGANLVESNYGWYDPWFSTAGNVLWCGLATQSNDSFRGLSLTLYDRNPTVDFSCEAWGFDNNATQVYYSGVRTSTGSGAAAQVLNMNTGIPTSAHFYSLRCTVPQSSGGAVSHITEINVD